MSCKNILQAVLFMLTVHLPLFHIAVAGEMDLTAPRLKIYPAEEVALSGSL